MYWCIPDKIWYLNRSGCAIMQTLKETVAGKGAKQDVVTGLVNEMPK